MSTISDYFLSDHAANEGGFRSEKRNIPFLDQKTGTIKVKLLYEGLDKNSPESFIAELPKIKRLATSRIVLHYFPEFYAAYRRDARSKEGTVDMVLNSTYHRLRTSINDPTDSKLSAVFYDPHSPVHRGKHMVLVTLTEFNFPLTRTDVETLQDFDVVPMDSPLFPVVQGMTAPAADEVAPWRTRSPQLLKELLGPLDLLPSMLPALELFNEDEGISSGDSSTTLEIDNLISDNELVQDGLSSFQSQLDGFPGNLPVSLDFSSAQRGMMQILNGVVAELMNDLTDPYNSGIIGEKVMASEVEFGEADLLVLEFGSKRNIKGTLGGGNVISSIYYVVNNLSTSRQFLRTGYMTNMIWNSDWKDELILATLKNYDFLVEMMKAGMGPGGTQTSFVDFLQNSSGDFGIDSNFAWDDLPKPVDTENLFLKEAAKYGIIDLRDVKKMENGFKLALTPRELREYRQKVRDNPRIFRKVQAANKAKVLKTGENILKVLEGITEGNFAAIKKNSKLGKLLRSIGIDELAKEAMICATFGLAPAFGRLITAVKNAVVSVGQDLYVEPPLPKPGGALSMQEINVKFFKIFTIDGDLWKIILKSMLDSLMEGVLEIVKGLAKLLKELCNLNNPRAEDFGENNLADLIDQNLAPAAHDLPNISNQSALNPQGGTTPGDGSPLGQLFRNQGFDYDQIMRYLTDLSEILSSMDICLLFTSREEVSYELLERILDFNLEYSDLQIRTSLNSHSLILGFFAQLSTYVDMTDFCNEILNDLFNANIDNLCLLEEAAPDAISQILQDLAEGVTLPNPGGPPWNGAATPDRPENAGINLECPLRPGYIENPLFGDTIPNLLKTLTRVVEEDFVNSVGAAQQALKEPGIANDPSTQLVAETMRAANAFGAQEEREEMSKIGRAILEAMSNIFAQLGDALDYMNEYCDVGDILGLDAEIVEQVIVIVVEILQELLNDPEFADALQGIADQIAGLQGDANTPGGVPPAITYTFPDEFRVKFDDYMGAYPVFKPEATFTTLDAAAKTSLVSSGEFHSTTPGLYGAAGTYGSYKQSKISFRFPGKVASSWRPVADSTGAPIYYEGSAIQKFKFSPPDAFNNVDSLTIKFPGMSAIASDTETKYIDVDLQSKILPTDVGSTNFGISTPPSITPPDNGRDTNPYVALFSDEFINKMTYTPGSALIAGQGQLQSKLKREVDTVLFPSVYGGFVEAAFNYVKTNGIFDTNKLNSLNFFHDNRNCLPEDVADLLDVSTILEELNNEMLDALCYDADSDGLNPTGTKIREVIRYGLFLLFLQIHIAQFIIKNIFVFASFQISHILGDDMVKQFMANSIRQQAESALKSNPTVRHKMIEYFNKKIKRPYARQNGGLRNVEGEIVFPVGKTFVSADFPALIEYLVSWRIENSRQSVSNAVKNSSPDLDPKPFNRAFVDDIVTVQPSWLGAWRHGQGADATAKVYVRQNPARSGGTAVGAYPSQRQVYHQKNWNTSKANLIENSKNILRNNQLIKTLSYGKVVLERRVVWESVAPSTATSPVPAIIDKTTGLEYGLELDIFKAALFGARDQEGLIGTTADPSLTFTNLAIKYDIVYYCPESVDLPVPVEYTAAEKVIYEKEHGKPPPTPYTGEVIAGGWGEEDKLFTSDFGPHLTSDLKMDFGDDLTLYRIPLRSLNLSVPVSNEISTTEVQSKYVFNPTAGQYEMQDVPILKSQLAFYGPNTTDSELVMLVLDPVFKDYFGKTFNRDLIMLVPIMHNFYLTTSFFPKFDMLLKAPKDRCIEIFMDSVHNENAVTSPRERMSPQTIAALGNDPAALSDLSQSVLEFILKMLIETPINILKGVSEMMDPHVGLSKLIRDITGAVFYQLGQAIDATPPIQQLRGPNPDTDPDAEVGATVPGIAPGIDGEGVLKLVFCILALAMEASKKGFHLYPEPKAPTPDDPFPAPPSPDAKNFLSLISGPLLGNPFVDRDGNLSFLPTDQLKYSEGSPDPRDPRNNMPPEIKDNLFPRISVEGVDFTGTFLGLLMIPPGPFGIVYLLLMLLKNLLTEQLEEDLGGDRSNSLSTASGEDGSEC